MHRPPVGEGRQSVKLSLIRSCEGSNPSRCNFLKFLKFDLRHQIKRRRSSTGSRASRYEREGCRFESFRLFQFWISDLGFQIRFAFIPQIQNPQSKIQNHFGFVQSAGRLALNQQIEVPILDPKPTRVFRRWLYGLDLESSVRRFESCRPDQFLQARVA